MIRTLFLALIITGFTLSCADNSVRRSNSIVIICDKELVYADTLYLIDKGEDGPNVYETAPTIFNFYVPCPEKIEPVSIIPFDTISIPIHSDYAVVEYHYNPIETVEFIARSGDTVVIDNCAKVPRISLKNRIDQGVNYEYHRNARFDKINGFSIDALLKLPQILIFRPLYKKNYNEALTFVRDQHRVNITDESLWLDSLQNSKLLDSIQYRYYKIRNRYQSLNMELDTLSKAELRSILASYSDSSYKNDFYRFYSTYYDRVAQKYYYDKTIQFSNGSDYDFKDAYQRIEQDTLLRGRLRDVHLSHCFRKIDEIFSIDDGKKYYDKIIKSITDTTILNALHRDYDNVYAQNITFSDDLVLQNTDGIPMTLQKVLAANVGKVIYIDFWASWCAPCMAGMPASKKLREEYKNKDVIFIYLAFNDKEQAWKTAISKAALSDVKNVYLVTNPRTSKVVDNLKLKTIPRYLIYDKKGQLVNSNAPRPESDEIRSLLNKYL